MFDFVVSRNNIYPNTPIKISTISINRIALSKTLKALTEFLRSNPSYMPSTHGCPAKAKTMNGNAFK